MFADQAGPDVQKSNCHLSRQEQGSFGGGKGEEARGGGGRRGVSISKVTASEKAVAGIE